MCLRYPQCNYTTSNYDRFGCIMLLAANTASIRDKERVTQVSDVVFLLFVLTLTQMTSHEAVYQTSQSSFWSLKTFYTRAFLFLRLGNTSVPYTHADIHSETFINGSDRNYFVLKHIHNESFSVCSIVSPRNRNGIFAKPHFFPNYF